MLYSRQEAYIPSQRKHFQLRFLCNIKNLSVLKVHFFYVPVKIPPRTQHHQVFFNVLQVNFPTYDSYQDTSNICPVLEVFFPLLQVHFLRTLPTRTHRVFALSSKYFFLSSNSIFYVRYLPQQIKYLPYPPSPFSTYDSYQNRSSICPILQVLYVWFLP